MELGSSSQRMNPTWQNGCRTVSQQGFAVLLVRAFCSVRRHLLKTSGSAHQGFYRKSRCVGIPLRSYARCGSGAPSTRPTPEPSLCHRHQPHRGVAPTISHRLKSLRRRRHETWVLEQSRICKPLLLRKSSKKDCRSSETCNRIRKYALQKLG